MVQQIVITKTTEDGDMKPLINLAGLHNSRTRDRALIDIGQWVIDTCLVFGCRPELAWQVASIFVSGLRKDLEAEK